MRIAFYAPLKPPDHPVPSGDRRMARLLMQAMEKAGHEVELANRLRARDGAGRPERQERLSKIGRSRAERLLRLYGARPDDRVPDLWFTYHLYYKAPDWIGPRVAAGLGIPYVVCEASVANKRAEGPWATGHRATLAALEQASLVLSVNPADSPALPDQARVRFLRPFIDAQPFRAASEARARLRLGLASRHGLDPERPWMIAVAMMRPGDKLASYRLLAEALGRLDDLSWELLLLGDGSARPEVERAFAPLNRPGGRHAVHFLGEAEPGRVAEALAASDLFVWPAINEAYGMALLEAQAASLPLVVGDSGGVSTVVGHGDSGLLVPPGNAPAFATALRDLLLDRERRHTMSALARARITANHTLGVAAAQLDAYLREARRIGPRAPTFLDIFGVPDSVGGPLEPDPEDELLLETPLGDEEDEADVEAEQA